ncbi:hypothetical protein [Corynebacterium caspium]|uniref:hypothetical protein n=1 Tax=Corynebacterium caspium TaxID=234828 RepID=UPI00037A4CA0|nr:hypothetical protein [Corynebacterium caspium]WKD59573.1 Alpha helical Porin B [Corynebacterium caspium DSM 44850]
MSFIRRIGAAVLTAALATTMLSGTASAAEWKDKNGNYIGLIAWDKGDTSDPELSNKLEWITCTIVDWSIRADSEIAGKRLTRQEFAKHLSEKNRLQNYTASKLPWQFLNIAGAEAYAKRAQQCNLVDPNPKLPAGSSNGSSSNPYTAEISSTISSQLSSAKK